MRLKKRNSRLLSTALLLTPVAAVGCIRAELPSSLPLELPSETVGARVEAPKDSGAARLADSTWTVWIVEFDASLSDGPIHYELGDRMLGEVEMDHKGGLYAVMIEDVWLDGIPLNAILGERLLLDAQPHPAGIPGALVVAENYSADDGNAVNLTGYGVISVGPIEGGRAQLAVMGDIDETGTVIEGDVIVDYWLTGLFADGADFVETVRYGIVAVRQQDTPESVFGQRPVERL